MASIVDSLQFSGVIHSACGQFGARGERGGVQRLAVSWGEQQTQPGMRLYDTYVTSWQLWRWHEVT